MPTDKILKFKRGNTTKNNAYTGSDGELTVDRTKKTLVVHDGINAGGSPLATEESVNNVIQELENKVDTQRFNEIQSEFIWASFSLRISIIPLL